MCVGEYSIKKKKTVSWENFSLIKSLWFTASLSIFGLCSFIDFFIQIVKFNITSKNKLVLNYREK